MNTNIPLDNKLNIIIAITPSFGIGLDDKMAWYDKDELRLFRQKTKDGILIMGRKTVESLPPIFNRTIFRITRNSELLQTTIDVNNLYYYF